MPQSTITAPEKLSDLPLLLHSAEGFSSVLSALEKGQSVTVDGAWGSSAGLAAATLARSAPHTTLIVIGHPRDLDAWAGDLSSFGGIRPAVLPAWDNHPSSGIIDEVAGQRLRLLKQMEGDDLPRVVLTTFQALLQPVPDRAQLARNRRTLKPGQTIDLEEWAAWLVEHGYRATEAVELPGEFSRRGGILDIYPPDADAPYRLELFGDEIDSIRQFSAQTQRSLGVVESAEVSAVTSSSEGQEAGLLALGGHFCDYLPAGSWTVLVELEELAEQGRHYLDRIIDATGLYSVEGAFARLVQFPSIKIASLPSPTVETACHLRVESVEQLSGGINRIRDELDSVAARDHVLIACPSEAEVKRLGEVLAAGDLARSDRLRVVTGRVRAGFRLLSKDDKVTRWQGDKGTEDSQVPVTLSPGHLVTSSSVVVLGGQELFHRDEARQVLPRRRLESRAIDSFLDLTEGDLVVHVSHGIARFRGMQMVEKNATPGAAPVLAGEGPGRRGRHTEEHLVLEFKDGVRVYVPVSRIDLVQKYVGGGKSDPELSKFGGTAWQKRKDRVQLAVMDLASDMIGLQAIREAQPGLAYPPDSEWQAEFEGAFPYQETPDQLTTLTEIKADMERPRPMDRLICGDVGYGKTELAIRAAFKTIDNGRQVAVLVPTTILAEQHFRTFSQRFAEFPFVVECLSRFRSAGQQRRIIERLGRGGIDVIIGTHRIVSADVRFKDLGLVVIDEEQRFGVEHKERLKQLRQQVDVLTLTATPIPRTLHLSLLGIRDISNLETPPPDRLAIETRIVRFDPQLIRNAVLREMNREGQIYFVHNRVQDIHQVAARLEQIVPEARIAIVHGQMSEGELEEGMLRFIRRDADILLATTIIESGLDIPNANTLFINQADRYGLADLHQLRGRVGRYKHRAYAYLLLDGTRQVSPNAAKRLKAIEEFTSLGAGFKIAMRDLEIRGAGNILGTQQSGHIAAVGYELYCQLLEEAVRQLKQLPLRTPLEVTIDLPWLAFLPRDYLAGQKARIEVYRRLTRVRKLDRLEDFRQELRDRFGPIPEPAERLLRLQELRLLAATWRVASLHLEGPAEGLSGPTEAVLNYRNAKKMKELAQRAAPHLRIVDDSTAYFRLGSHELEPEPLYHALRELLQV